MQTQVCVSPGARGRLANAARILWGVNGSLVAGNFHARVGLVSASDQKLLIAVGHSHDGKTIDTEPLDRFLLVEFTQQFVSNPPCSRALTERARGRTHGVPPGGT